MTQHEPAAIFQRNLTALTEHRPAVAALLRDRKPLDAGYRISTVPDGRLVVAHPDAARTPGGPTAEQALREAFSRPSAAVVGGVGDGRVLGLVAARPRGLHGAASVVYLCEPDLDRLASALGTTDLTGATGPIEQSAVRWFVGADWQEAYHNELAEEPLLPLPDIHARLGVGEEAEHAWKAVAADRRCADATAAESARAWARSDEIEGLAAMAGGADRVPRVLLIASRFTQVIRHSIAGAARGFAALRWEARICTERADHERLTPEAVLHAVGAFRPDLIVTVNYHRHHFAGLPGGIPFVCWIQDDMPHLIEPGAGDRLGERDFVMGTWVQRYCKEWGYRKDRCVVVPRMTDAACQSVPFGATSGDDLVYVSNHSGMPREILDRLRQATGADTVSARTALRAGEALIAIYEDGGAVANPHDLRRITARVAEAEGMETPDPAWLTRVSEMLALHLNNPLYRQQGLDWAVGAARDRGLSLAVYGSGWDRHPRFASYARGVLAYGEDLDRVTRSARFNLRLEPYPAMCHQRLIDSLAAGGMVLSRRYSEAEEPEAIFVDIFLRRLAHRARSVGEAVALLDGPERDGFIPLCDRLHRAVPRLAGKDLVAYYHERLHEGSLGDYIHSRHPPGFFDIVFGSEAELGAVIDRSLAEPDSREDLVRRQRAFIVERHSYPAGLGRLLSEIRVSLLEPVTPGLASGSVA